MYAEFTKKKVFELLTIGAGTPACHSHGRQEVSIPECNLTGRRSTITLLLVRSHSIEISLPENETTVNLKSASFLEIVLSHEGLTHIQSQIKPLLLFGKSFTLRPNNPTKFIYVSFKMINHQS